MLIQGYVVEGVNHGLRRGFIDEVMKPNQPPINFIELVYGN